MVQQYQRISNSELEAKIQELQAERDALFETNRQLESALDQQRNFVDSAMHDLRTPLTSVKGYAQLMLRMHLAKNPNAGENDSYITQLKIIIAEADRANKMTQYSDGAYVIDLNTLARAVITGQQFLASTSGVQIKRDLSGQRLEILADYRNILGAANNLVKNGIEETSKNPGGIVTIRAYGTPIMDIPGLGVPKAFESYDITGRVHCFEVENSGPGIPQEIQQKILGLTQPGAKPFTTKAGGSGRGLQTTTYAINESGGCLSVYSVPGKTVFTAIFPVPQEK